METAEIVVKVLRWAGEAVLAFIRGDEGPAPKRLVEILPDELRADVEHARQRRLLEEEIRADLDQGEHPADDPETETE